MTDPLPAEIEQRRQAILSQFADAEDELTTAIERLNERLADQDEIVREAAERYNDLVVRAGHLADEASDAVADYLDEYPDPVLLEGKAGRRYRSLRDAFIDLDFMGVRVDVPSQVRIPEFGAVTELRDRWPTLEDPNR